MAAQPCHSNTCEDETGGLVQVQGQSGYIVKPCSYQKVKIKGKGRESSSPCLRQTMISFSVSAS